MKEEKWQQKCTENTYVGNYEESTGINTVVFDLLLDMFMYILLRDDAITALEIDGDLFLLKERRLSSFVRTWWGLHYDFQNQDANRCGEY